MRLGAGRRRRRWLDADAILRGRFTPMPSRTAQAASPWRPDLPTADDTPVTSPAADPVLVALASATAAMLLLGAAVVQRRTGGMGQPPAARWLVVAAVSGAAQLLTLLPTGPQGVPLPSTLVHLLGLVGLANVAAAWGFAVRLLDDRPGPAPWVGLACAALVLSPAVFWGAAVGVLPPAVAAAWSPWGSVAPALAVLHLLVRALAGWRDDLVDERRRLRAGLVVAVALTLAAVLVGESIGGAAGDRLRLSAPALLAFGGMAVLASWPRAAWGGTTRTQALASAGLGDGRRAGGADGVSADAVRDAREDALAAAPTPSAAAPRPTPLAAPRARTAPAAPPPHPPQPESPGLHPADRLELRRLQRFLAERHPHRDPTLDLPSLAAQLGLPPHRLRRLINGQLGYRNFPDFVNDARLADAQRLLADPALARQPVLTLAMDAGFASLATFNRVFKARLGETPSAFRRRALNASLGDAPGREDDGGTE
jgi:AraC-like DNA-binding protein